MSLSERLGSVGGGGVKPDDPATAAPRPPDTGDNGTGSPLLQRMAIIQKDEKGYGLTVSGDNPVYVASVKPDGAAARAGVQTGDRIIKVNGKLVTNSNHTEVVKMIKSGSYVALTLLGKPSATQTDRDSVVEHREREPGGISRESVRESIADRITAPLPVDAEKEKDLYQQKKNTIRAMFEHAQDEYDSLKKVYKFNQSEKVLSQLQDKEKTLRILEAQLHERPISSYYRDSQIPTLVETDVGSNQESTFTGWLPKRHKHIKHSSSPGAMYRPSEPSQPRTGSGVFRSKSDVSSRKPSELAVGGDGTDAERGSSLRRKFGKQKKLLQKTSSVPAVSDITSSVSPQRSPSASPTPVHPHNIEPEPAHPDTSTEDGSLSSTGMSSRPTTQIIGMEDEDFASEDESQDADRRSRPVSQFLAKLQNLETGDSRVFSDLRALDAKPAHMAIFLHYVLVHHNPAPLLFYQLSGIYSQAQGSVKDLKKWAYEIHSTFLVQQAPLKIIVDDSTIDQIDQILVRPEIPHMETLRGLFHKARLLVTDDVRKLLEDLRQKKEQGLIEGSSELKDQMDRSEELRIIDKYLLPDLDKCVQHEEDDKYSAQGWAIATFLRQVGPSKQSQHSVLERVQSFIAKDKKGSKAKKSSKGHVFVLQHMYKQEFCMQCKSVLWGVGFQGYQCTTCELCVHKQCIDAVEEMCSKKKKRISTSMTVFKPKQTGSWNTSLKSALSDMLSAGIGIQVPANHNSTSEGDKEFTSPTNPQQPHVVTQPYKEAEDKEKTAFRDGGHTVNSLVGRYNHINTGSSPEPETTIGKKATDLCRSESAKGRGDQKSDRPPRRSKSDVDVDNNLLTMINTSQSSSSSSLSNRSGESPSGSMDTLTYLVQDDSDFDVEPELPSLKQVLGEDVVRKLKPKEKKRQDVINELFYTEKSHVRNLKILDKLFYRPMLKEPSIAQEFTKSLFPNLETMTALHKSLNNSMKSRRKEKSVIAAVGDILLQRFDGEAGENFRNGCAIFCRNQSHSLETLKVRMRKEPKLTQLLSDAENNPLLQRLALKDIIPRQFMRLTKYPLLIENLLRYTPTNTEEHVNLVRSLECSKHILNYVNQAVKDCENHQRLIDLQRRIDKKMIDVDNSPEMDELKTFDLSKHKLIHDGGLTWRINNKKSIELHVVLLERAMVLLQKQEDKLILRLQSTLLVAGKDDSKRHSPLLWLNNILARNDASNSKAFFVVNTSKTGPQIYQLVAYTEQEQKKWTKIITQASEAQKKQEISSKKKLPVPTGEIVAHLDDQRTHDSLSGQHEVSPLPDLIHPDEVDVHDAYSSTDIHVISPLERLRHNTENLDAVLEERQGLIAEMLNVSPDELPDKVKDLEEESNVPQDLIVACHHQTSQLVDLMKEGSHILQEKAHDSGELVDSLDDLQLPIPMDRLRDMSSRMNHILTNLLAAVNSKDEQHDRLRQELKFAQDELDRLRRIQQAAAPLLESQADAGRPASLVSDTGRPASLVSDGSTMSESGDENHDDNEQATDVIEVTEDGMPGIPIVLEPDAETDAHSETLSEVSPVIEETLPDLEAESVVCVETVLEGEQVTECLEAEVETVEETLHEVEPPEEDELEDLDMSAIQLVGDGFHDNENGDNIDVSVGLQRLVNRVFSSETTDVDDVDSRLSGDDGAGEQSDAAGREQSHPSDIFHDSTDGLVEAATVRNSGGATEIRTFDTEIDGVNMQNNTSDISKNSLNESDCESDCNTVTSHDSKTIDTGIMESTDEGDLMGNNYQTDTTVTDLNTLSAEQV